MFINYISLSDIQHSQFSILLMYVDYISCQSCIPVCYVDLKVQASDLDIQYIFIYLFAVDLLFLPDSVFINIYFNFNLDKEYNIKTHIL